MPPRRIPLAVKVAYSAFAAVLVPSYLRTYPPANFLFFCDVGALLTLVGLWLESPLLIGTQAVAVLVPQTVWVVDVASRLCGFKLTDMTGYMFDPTKSLFVRGLSTFHGWLPLLLIWAVRRVGYDRRSLPVQCVLGTVLLLVCYLLVDPKQNINYVFGPPGGKPPPMPGPAWLAVVVAASIVGMFVPAHLLLRWVAPPPPPPPRR